MSLDPYRDVPPPDEEPPDAAPTTTWAPLDLGPYLRGEVEPVVPSLGLRRSDGLAMFYPGREHAVVGETESGKTWFVLAGTALELQQSHTVLYVHFEESDPQSTVERLLLLGVPDVYIEKSLQFVAPSTGVRPEEVAALRAAEPTLVILDGVNEGMTLHSAATKDVEGWATFRRRVISPFLRAGIAVVTCDHLPMGSDGSRRDAYGTVHKGNTIDGARFVLENKEPFGREMRGRSLVFVTKDRPGHLRKSGRPGRTAGKTYLGTLVIDDCTRGPDFHVGFYAPKDGEDAPASAADDALAGQVLEAINTQPGHTVVSKSQAVAAFRLAGGKARKQDVLDSIDVLVLAGRLEETPGKTAQSHGYRVAETGSHG